MAYDIFEMTQQSLWNNHSLATFIFEIKDYDKSEGINAELTTNWVFYLVTDAYPCQPTEWSNWTECDAKPVGIGHIYRSKIAVHGLTGLELMCNELSQHEICVVNQGNFYRKYSQNVYKYISYIEKTKQFLFRE